MTDVYGPLQRIIHELSVIYRDPVRRSRQDGQRLPGLIYAGSGRSIVTNEAIEIEIRNVADWMLEQRPKAQDRQSLKEWRSKTREAFGPALAQLDFSRTPRENARELKVTIEASLDEYTADHSSRGRSLGCRLFCEPMDDPFSIGPVVFQTKSRWLDRALRNSDISITTHRRLTRAFGGAKLRKRKPSLDSIQEESILDVLCDAQMVCTVTTEGMAQELGEERTILAARLALTSIALIWREPSRMLESFGLSTDHGIRVVRLIPVAPGPRMAAGSRLIGRPFGMPVSQEEWASILGEEQKYFELSGKMIFCWTSPEHDKHASSLLRGLSRALFWFWKGCTEESNLMSIIALAAALESLTGGGQSSAIKKLVKARLGKDEKDEIVSGITLKQLVKRIYEVGRSRTLHGTNKDMLHDWSDARAMAESLTRACIISSMEWCEQNESERDIKMLLR